MDVDSSLIISELGVSLTDLEDGSGSATSDDPPISNLFLTISNLILSAKDIVFERELTPLLSLDIIGDGLSFCVKRSPQQKKAYLVDDPVFAYKISKAGLSSTDREKAHTSAAARHRIRALVTECRVLTHLPLANHENIVSLKRILWTPDPDDTAKTTICLVLEHAEFSTLAHLQRYGSIHPIAFELKKKLCLDVAEGLLALHGCGITHGDVKTENILIFRHDEHKYTAKLSDFGCAIISSSKNLAAEDAPARLVGYTPYFRAPEGGDLLPSSQLHLTDVYSYGLLVWRVLADGNEPFSTFFDLPAETAARHAAIARIQSVGYGLSGFVVASIQEVVAPYEISSEETNQLIVLFLHTLALEPLARSLESAARQLRQSLDIATAPRHDATQPIQLLPSKFDLLPRSVEFMAVLGVPLQRCFYQALEDTLSQYEQSSAADCRGDNKALAYGVLYSMISCRLSGIGCEKDPTEIFRLLLKLTMMDGMAFLFASSTILSIRDALGGEITPEEADEALNATIIGAANESLTACRWIQDRIPDIFEHPRYTTLRDRRLRELHGMTQDALDVRSSEGFQHHAERLMDNIQGDEPIFGQGNTICHAVALFGDVKMLEHLVYVLGCSVDLQNALGETPLLLASMHGRSQEALYLMNTGANVTLLKEAGLIYYLPIMRPEDIEAITQALYVRGVRIQQPWCAKTSHTSNNYFSLDTIEGDAMLKAIGTNRLDVVKSIIALSEGSIPTTFEKRVRYFAYSIEAAAQLHTAAILEHLLDSLIAYEGNMEKKSIGRAWKTEAGDSLMRYVISAEDTTNRISIHGSRFLTAAKDILQVLDSFGFVEPVLVFHSRTQSTLLCALEAGNEEMATSLLSFDAIVGAIDTPDPGTGYTPLHSCIRHGAKSTFDRLIELGAQYKEGISYPPGSGDTVSYLALCASHRAELWFAERLLDLGVSADAPDTYGNPSLSLALMRQCYGLAKLLIHRGAGLNRVLSTGFTVAGTLLHPTVRQSFYDFLGAIGFIFSLQDANERPNFVINPTNQLTFLHMAVKIESGTFEQVLEDSSVTPANRFDALTALVLKHFSEPHHVNAKAVNGITPLHIAIANRNLSAVRLLLEAGADVAIPPPSQEYDSTLSMARGLVLLFGNQLLIPGQIPQPAQELAQRSSAIANLIYMASPELPSVPLYSAVLELYKSIEPFIAQMRQLEHSNSKMLGLESIVIRAIGEFSSQQNIEKTKDIFEYQALVNSLVQPWIMSEVTISFMSSETLSEHNTQRHELIRRAVENIPWLYEFTKIGISEIQQAALFECILQELKAGHGGLASEESYLNRYMAYSMSRNSDDLPDSPMLVRYPHPLKDIYERILKLDAMEGYDRRDIIASLRYLDGGSNPDRFSAADPQAMTREEFLEFHLHTLQGQELRLEELRGALLLSAKCGCHNHKIRKITPPKLELLTRSKMPTSETVQENANETSLALLNSSEIASTTELAPTVEQEQIGEPGIANLQISDLNTCSGVEIDEDGVVEHFGIFCAGVTCADKIWSHSFIRGVRALCQPCQTASFCEDCMKSHAHPRLYVHGVLIKHESQISEMEYQNMRAAGRFVGQTVWERGWLNESGQLILDGERIPFGTPYPIEHIGFSCDGAACAESGQAEKFIRGVRYHCETCGDADFCAVCEPAHDQTHQLARINENRMTAEQLELVFQTQHGHDQHEESHGRDDLLYEMLNWTVLDYRENSRSSSVESELH